MRTLYNVTLLTAIVACGNLFWGMMMPEPLPATNGDPIAEIIRDHESGLIQEQSLRNILFAMGRED